MVLSLGLGTDMGKGTATANNSTHHICTPQAMTSNQFSLHQSLYYDYVITNYFMNIILSILQRHKDTYLHTHTYICNIHTESRTQNTPFSKFVPLKRLLRTTRSMTIFTYTYIHPIHTPFRMFYVLRPLTIPFPDFLTMSNDMQS